MPQKPSTPRDPIAGPQHPESPYPLRLRGPVIKGFGRGSKDLGIPTANIPIEGLDINGHTDLESGIYYGWASLDYSTIEKKEGSEQGKESSNHAVADLVEEDELISKTMSGRTVYPTVLSIGYNPYFSNPTRSIEIHLLSTFARDFYGATLSLLILGYIRPEYDYVSMDALVEDIREDIRVARRSLDRDGYLRVREVEEAWLDGGDEERREGVRFGRDERGGLVGGEMGGQVDGIGVARMMP
ncbi:riboflavin kinase [Sporormia fimetaria CBS 119925]|uniref:Riboflavin kinase n=1 Tax=Sporormia fimetaria CBS 119925 TaxID=1340428 RepID=A0A6A6V4A5_9PLEO|nr:riboflavin kinase [Sporormia fimetaria CBS 119925]